MAASFPLASLPGIDPPRATFTPPSDLMIFCNREGHQLLHPSLVLCREPHHDDLPPGIAATEANEAIK